jgi:hypothetical protein
MMQENNRASQSVNTMQYVIWKSPVSLLQAGRFTLVLSLFVLLTTSVLYFTDCSSTYTTLSITQR